MARSAWHHDTAQEEKFYPSLVISECQIGCFIYVVCKRTKYVWKCVPQCSAIKIAETQWMSRLLRPQRSSGTSSRGPKAGKCQYWHLVTEALRLVRKKAAWSAWKPKTWLVSRQSCHAQRHATRSVHNLRFGKLLPLVSPPLIPQSWNFLRARLKWRKSASHLLAHLYSQALQQSMTNFCVRRCCHTSGFKMVQEGNIFCCAFAPVLENWWKMGAKVRITKLLQAISGENHQHSSTHCRVAPQEPLSPSNPSKFASLWFQLGTSEVELFSLILRNDHTLDIVRLSMWMLGDPAQGEPLAASEEVSTFNQKLLIAVAPQILASYAEVMVFTHWDHVKSSQNAKSFVAWSIQPCFPGDEERDDRM